LPSHLDFEESDAKKIYPFIKKLHYKPKGGKGELTANSVIEIFGQYKSDKEFIDNTNEFKWPKIKKLKFQRMDCMTSFESIESVNKFFTKAIIFPIKFLKLSCWEYQVDLNKFIDGLSQVLQLVQKQVYISNCVMDEDIFETVIEVGTTYNL
jgi:hypothetical protein